MKVFNIKNTNLYFEKLYLLFKKNIQINQNISNDIILGRWCSSNHINNLRTSQRLFELGNSDNCYLSNYQYKVKNK